MDEPPPIEEDLTEVTIRVDVEGADVAVVTVAGDLDLVTAPDLNDALAGARGRRAIVVDLSAVDFIDSSGLAVLVNLNRSATRDGTPLALVSARTRVQNTFAITGLSTVLPFHDARDAALAAVS